MVWANSLLIPLAAESKSLILSCVALSFVLSILGSLAIVTVPLLAPSPSYIDMTYGDSPIAKDQFLRNSLYERILETLAMRNATDSRDMSFGLRSVLEKFADGNNLPPVDYKQSQLEVFRQLTVYLGQRLKSQQLLIMAAQSHCEGGPSWVPDYSQSLIAVPFRETSNGMLSTHLFGNFATSQSETYCKALAGNENILVVKGFMVEQITVVRGYNVETASYWGTASTKTMVGDRVALISGLAQPLVLRDTEVGSLKIIAVADLHSKGQHKQTPKVNPFLNGQIWEAHIARKEKEWKEQLLHFSTPDGIYGPNPTQYLDDLLIS